MSYPPLELSLSGPSLVVVAWHDDLVDPIGFDSRSQYVELFWLNILGPTATWLMRRMATGLDEYPGGFSLDLAETAQAMGLAFSTDASTPFTRAINRCVLFGVAQPVSGGMAVRRRLPPVAQRHLQRMPAHLRVAHSAWSRRESSTTNELQRASVLAQAMVSVGDDPDVVERQLLGLGVAPLTALDAIDALHLTR